MVILFLVGIFFLFCIAASKGKKASSRVSRRQDYQAARVRISMDMTARRSPGSPKLNDRLTSDRCWIPKGRRVEVQGFTVPGGMIYVGEGLTAVGDKRSAEPAALDPRAKATRPAGTLEELGYWPSYGQITSAQRGRYLAWLSGGREDAGVDIGYVFLFFYGLERRVLIDLAESREHAEILEIAAEVKRLRGLFGSNGSFMNYSAGLLDAIQVKMTSGSLYLDAPGVDEAGYGIPFQTKVAIGQAVADGKPIPVQWALSWLRHSGLIGLHPSFGGILGQVENRLNAHLL